MNRLPIFSILLAGIFLSACGNTSLVPRNSYVLEYYSLKEMTLETDRYVSEEGEPYLRLRVIPKKEEPAASLFSHTDRFRELCEQTGDLSYEGGTMDRTYEPIVTCRYPEKPFSRLSVSGDADIPDPVVVTVSPWPFIRSGYKPCNYGEVKTSEFFRAVYPFREGFVQPFYPVEKHLSALTADDMTLPGLGDRAYLPQLFTLFIPYNPALSHITLTLQDCDGNVFVLESYNH